MIRDRRLVDQRLDELADDDVAACHRVAACELLSSALDAIGRRLRADGLRHGSLGGEVPPTDLSVREVNGLGTLAKIGAELARGAIALLRADNLYAAGALVRQHVEVEFLARAFAIDHQVVSTWLGSGRGERSDFWSPDGRSRRVGNGLLADDYTRHCEVGGYPTMRAARLLPGPARTRPAEVWVDLAGHLDTTLQHVIAATERLHSSTSAASWNLPEVGRAIDDWRRTDGLVVALQDLAEMRRSDASLD